MDRINRLLNFLGIIDYDPIDWTEMRSWMNAIDELEEERIDIYKNKIGKLIVDMLAHEVHFVISHNPMILNIWSNSFYLADITGIPTYALDTPQTEEDFKKLYLVLKEIMLANRPDFKFPADQE